MAAAGCDGFAYIYSIPHLDKVPKCEESPYPVFRVQPVAKLVPSLCNAKGLLVFTCKAVAAVLIIYSSLILIGGVGVGKWNLSRCQKLHRKFVT